MMEKIFGVFSWVFVPQSGMFENGSSDVAGLQRSLLKKKQNTFTHTVNLELTCLKVKTCFYTRKII